MGSDRACNGSIRRASYSFCLYRYLKQFAYHALSRQILGREARFLLVSFPYAYSFHL